MTGTSASTLSQSSVFSPHKGGLRRETRQDLVRTRGKDSQSGGELLEAICVGRGGSREAKGEKREVRT